VLDPAMSCRLSIKILTIASALLLVLGLVSVECHGVGESELAAANAVGRGDAAVLQLVREVTEWKARAEAAESLLAKSGLPLPAETRLGPSSQAQVMSSIESERVVILSAGKLSGAVLGALVSVGDDVVAKVVESRDTVSAAVVDQKYQGRVGALEGLRVRLLVVRP
jgi:hypothetical protein